MIYSVTTAECASGHNIVRSEKFFATRPHPQIYFGAHTKPFKPVSGSVSLETKSQLKAEGSPQSVAKIRNIWRFLCTLHDLLMTRCYLSLIVFLRVYFGQNYLIQFRAKDFQYPLRYTIWLTQPVISGICTVYI
jgi:hypothetical protein